MVVRFCNPLLFNEETSMEKCKQRIIASKSDLQEFLSADKKELGRSSEKPAMTDFVWRFEISLRHLEYYHNLRHQNFFQMIFKRYWHVRYLVNSLLCGFEIPLNVFGKGLSIAHRGTIVVNGSASVGENCRIHTCVNIGIAPGFNGLAPAIGNDVYI